MNIVVHEEACRCRRVSSAEDIHATIAAKFNARIQHGLTPGQTKSFLERKYVEGDQALLNSRLLLRAIEKNKIMMEFKKENKPAPSKDELAFELIDKNRRCGPCQDERTAPAINAAIEAATLQHA